MEFRDLKKQYQVLKPEMDVAMQQVIAAGMFIAGAPVKKLEEALACDAGTTHCVTCANGTEALSLMLMAWDIGAGDAVFIPDFTFFSTGEVVAFRGATPVFVDVLPDTFNMDPVKLEQAIVRVQKEGRLTPKLVIAVDLFGQPADFAHIIPLAKRYGLRVLEDGAQGFGGSMGGRTACGLADAGTTSFFPAKPLGCYGDGGAIFINDEQTAALLRSLCGHGKGSMKYDNVRIGVNSRLDTLQAAILLIKRKAFWQYELDAVNCVAGWYTARLADTVKTPFIPDGFGSSWAQYTLRLESATQRDAVQAKLRAQEIPTMVYYPKPMHHQLAFAGLANVETPCPVTETLCQTVLSLPMHPYLTEAEVETICNALKAAL